MLCEVYMSVDAVDIETPDHIMSPHTSLGGRDSGRTCRSAATAVNLAILGRSQEMKRPPGRRSLGTAALGISALVLPTVAAFALSGRLNKMHEGSTIRSWAPKRTLGRYVQSFFWILLPQTYFMWK